MKQLRMGFVVFLMACARQQEVVEHTAVSPENYPAILIDMGEDDPIIDLTNNLTEQLDAHKVPYTFQTAPGGHNAAYWSQHLEEYIHFLVED